MPPAKCWRAPTPPCTRAKRNGGAAAAGSFALRDDVGRQLVFDEGDAVAQLQLALLQPLDLDDVGAGQPLQRRDRGIEVAMLLLQARQLRPKLAFFLVVIAALTRAASVMAPGAREVSCYGLSRFG
jgi:hypothetical protein